MKTLIAEPIGRERFAEFGAVLPLDSSGPGVDGVVRTVTADWEDAHTAAPVMETAPHIGCTTSGAAPYTATHMERHRAAAEALFDAHDDLVLLVAPAGEGSRPEAAQLRAFRIPAKTLVILRPGVWHDACRGAEGPVSYVWVSTNGLAPSEGWVTIDDGPVAVALADAADD